MTDYFGAAQGLLGGAGALFGGLTAASGSKKAASFYGKSAALTETMTGLKEVAADRQLYQTLGASVAAVAANGLDMGGSATDLLRSSAQQGALTKAMIGLQGTIDVEGLLAKKAEAEAAASASKSGGIMSALGSVVGIAASIFSDDRLKRNSQLLGRRADGIGLYLFQYIGNDEWYEGVMASEVERIYPDAVEWELGFRKVDYDAIGMSLRQVGGMLCPV